MITTLLTVAAELEAEQHARGSHDHDSRIADLLWAAREHCGPFTVQHFQRWPNQLAQLWAGGFAEMPIQLARCFSDEKR